MEQSLPPSSRIDDAAPFPVQLKAAFDGVSRAMSAVEEITGSEAFEGFIETDYSFKIFATLKVEVDGLRKMVDSAWRCAGGS